MRIKKPSVTQLLELLAKPALIKWANQQGLAGIDVEKARKGILAHGISLHSQVEAANRGVLDFKDTVHEDLFVDFMRGKNVLGVEENIETEWYVGKYDCKIEADGVVWIVDYKTHFKGKMYLEQKLQLAAYGVAENVENLGIVSLPDFTFYPCLLSNKEVYQQMLITLSRLYYLKKQLE